MFSRNNPLKAIERRTVSLKNSIDNIVPKLRREHIVPERILGSLLDRHTAFASLWLSVRKEARAWPVYQAISLTGFDGISSSFSDFASDLEAVHHSLSGSLPPSFPLQPHQVVPVLPVTGPGCGQAFPDQSSVDADAVRRVDVGQDAPEPV